MDVRSSLLLVFLATTPLFSQTQHQAPVETIFPPAQLISGQVAPFQATMPMPTVAPLFLEGNGFSSTLVLINNSLAYTYADITVRGLDGNTLVSRRVNFDPHSELRISLANLLQNSAATAGSILVMQSSALAGPSIAGAVSMTFSGSGTPNYVDEELSMPDEKGSESLEGVVDRANGPPVLAISSLAESTQNVTVECFGEKGTVAVAQQLALGAGHTAIINACSGPEHEATDPLTSLVNQTQDTTYGPRGLKLTSDGMAGGFVAFALAPHQVKGDQFFSSVLFADPAMINSPNTVFTGIPVGQASLLPDGIYTPRISMTNFSTTALHVHTKFARTSGNAPQTKEVGTLTIPPQQSRELVFDGLQGDSDLQNSFIVYSDGEPGALMAKLVSTSNSQLHEVELQAKDASDNLNAGNHPWTVDGTTESTLLLFNHSSTPENFDVSIFGGSYTWQKTFKLAPMATLSVNIRKLIEDQVKDDSGNLLPKAAERGEINWMDVNPTRGSGRLLETDRSGAKARNFSCGYSGLLCGLNGLVKNGSVAVGADTDFAQIAAITCTSGQQNLCSGQITGSGGSFSYSWLAQDTSVATISGSNQLQSVRVHGVSPGSTFIVGRISSMYCAFVGTPTVGVYSVTVTNADIVADQIAVTLSGPASATGTLTVQLVGPSTTTLATVQNAGPGNRTFQFGRNSLAVGDYTSVTANWTPDRTFTASKAVSFYSLGVVHHTQYNSPYETSCSGAPASAYITESNCSNQQGTLKSDFMSQVDLRTC
jgi:hypothetical protein